MEPSSSLPALNMSLPLHELVMLVALIIIGMYTIFSAVFYYHWQAYATDGKVQNITIALYFLATIPLLLIMGISAFLIQ